MTGYDEALLSRVTEELNWDTSVEANNIRVKVSDGVATLTGEVESYAAKIAAQEAAHRVIGVHDVANDIVVHPRQLRTDTEIAHAVRHALEWNPRVPHESIETTVTDGVVILSGSVARLRQWHEAEEAVWDLVGVRDVINLIELKPGEAATEAAREAIHSALERQAGREADRITVSLAPDGTVAVAGMVRSWAERRAVLGAAGHAPGVIGVQDFLAINPSI